MTPRKPTPRETGTNPRAQGTNPRERSPLKDLDLSPEFLRSLPYNEYRKTKHWRSLRAAVRSRAGGACEACGAQGSTDTHHRSYERLGEERLSDLVALCRDCHRDVLGQAELRVESNLYLRNRAGVIVGRILRLEIELAIDEAAGALGTFKEGEVSDLEGDGGDQSGLAVDVGAQAAPDAGAQGAHTQAQAAVSARVAAREAIDKVWACYVEVMKPRRREAGVDERKIIADALKVATADECCAAIRGCHASDWHMGRDQRTRGKSYKTLSHILKGKRPNERNPQGRTTRETIDMFLELGAKRGIESHVPSVDPVRLRQAKQDVRDAHEFPGDRHTVERGTKARRWLQEQGYKVEQEGERLTFVPPTMP